MKRNKKPFIRHVHLNHGEDIPTDVCSTLYELDYDIYESPIDGHDVFISNVPLTEGWFFKNYQHYDLKLRGWVPDDKDTELDSYNW